MQDKRQEKPTPVKDGDQSKKIDHKGSKMPQGDVILTPDAMPGMTDPSSVDSRQPKVKSQPKGGPFDSLNGKSQGTPLAMPEPGKPSK